MTELKPCPFCGELPEVIKEEYQECQCVTPGCPMYVYVCKFERWNTRPIEDALRAEVKRLRAEILAVAPFLAAHGVEGYSFMEND